MHIVYLALTRLKIYIYKNQSLQKDILLHRWCLTHYTAIQEERCIKRPFFRIPMSILRVLNSMVAAVERDSSFPRPRIEFSYLKSSLQLNETFLKGGVRRMMDRMVYRAVSMLFSIIRGFIY